MRKIFTLMFVVMLAGQAWADDFTIGNLKYTITDSEKHEVSVGQISYNDAPEGDLVIPAEVENEGVKYAVTSIRNLAFEICSSLTSVTIPNSVTIIGKSAFYYCTGLTTVTIPNSVTSIGKDAFGYVKNIVYSGSAEGSPWGALNVNAIPDEDGFIYSDAENTNLTAYVGDEKDVIIPNTVTSIRNYAFAGCSGLTSIVIGDSVTRIGNWAFSRCRSLTSVTIPESVTSIGENAFYYCTGLTTVTIPNSVNYIDDWAFYGCSGLTTVTIPNSVYHINDRVFFGCSGLTSVTIPNSVTSIGDFAFNNCSGLTSVTIPNSVTSIGIYAFYNCSGLTSVTISNSVASIGDCAFYGCIGLKSVTIPSSVTSIGDNAFCHVKNIVYSGSAEGSPWGALNVNAIPDEDGFIYSDAEKTNLTAYVGVEKEVIIPNSVKSIGMYSFANCGLTSVTIPNSVKYIHDYAFYDCRGLTSLSIPNSVTFIDYEAFADCSGLTSVFIPKSVTDIRDYVFNGITATIYCESESKPADWNSNWCGKEFKGEIVWGYKPTENQGGNEQGGENPGGNENNPGTAVAENAANAVNIYACGKNIVVENAAEEIRVYDVMGRLVCRDAINRVRTEIRINTAGLYIVKVGNVAKRVMVNN